MGAHRIQKPRQRTAATPLRQLRRQQPPPGSPRPYKNKSPPSDTATPNPISSAVSNNNPRSISLRSLPAAPHTQSTTVKMYPVRIVIQFPRHHQNPEHPRDQSPHPKRNPLRREIREIIRRAHDIRRDIRRQSRQRQTHQRHHQHHRIRKSPPHRASPDPEIPSRIPINHNRRTTSPPPR